MKSRGIVVAQPEEWVDAFYAVRPLNNEGAFASPDTIDVHEKFSVMANCSEKQLRMTVTGGGHHQPILAWRILLRGAIGGLVSWS